MCHTKSKHRNMFRNITFLCTMTKRQKFEKFAKKLLTVLLHGNIMNITKQTSHTFITLFIR